jgi:FMN-dependent NADH-azoreductase
MPSRSRISTADGCRRSGRQTRRRGNRRAGPEGASALDEFLAADIVVIGARMYNFTVPSRLKAWIDRILIAGRTFRYTEAGPLGLAGGKRVIIASSRGGLYASGMPFEAYDFQEKYLPPSLPSSGSRTSNLCAPRVLPSDRNGATRRYGPPWLPCQLP